MNYNLAIALIGIFLCVVGSAQAMPTQFSLQSDSELIFSEVSGKFVIDTDVVYVNGAETGDGELVMECKIGSSSAACTSEFKAEDGAVYNSGKVYLGSAASVNYL